MNNISAARARKQTMFDFLPLRQECEADRLKRANARSLFVISEVHPTFEAATQTQSCENRAASYFRPCSKVKGNENASYATRHYLSELSANLAVYSVRASQCTDVILF